MRRDGRPVVRHVWIEVWLPLGAQHIINVHLDVLRYLLVLLGLTTLSRALSRALQSPLVYNESVHPDAVGAVLGPEQSRRSQSFSDFH